jgi:hypothetical protein
MCARSMRAGAASAAGVARRKSSVSQYGARAEARRWASRWKRVGPLLEAERWRRLQTLTATQRAQMVIDLLSLWRPELSGDDGEALLRAQQAFSLWRRRH